MKNLILIFTAVIFTMTTAFSQGSLNAKFYTQTKLTSKTLPKVKWANQLSAKKISEGTVAVYINDPSEEGKSNVEILHTELTASQVAEKLEVFRVQIVDDFATNYVNVEGLSNQLVEQASGLLEGLFPEIKFVNPEDLVVNVLNLYRLDYVVLDVQFAEELVTGMANHGIYALNQGLFGFEVDEYIWLDGTVETTITTDNPDGGSMMEITIEKPDGTVRSDTYTWDSEGNFEHTGTRIQNEDGSVAYEGEGTNESTSKLQGKSGSGDGDDDDKSWWDTLFGGSITNQSEGGILPYFVTINDTAMLSEYQTGTMPAATLKANITMPSTVQVMNVRVLR